MEFVYNDYRIRVSPRLVNTLRPTEEKLKQVIDDLFQQRQKDGVDAAQSSTHPMLWGFDDNKTMPLWKVGIAILPADKMIYVLYPEEFPPGVTFHFPPMPAGEQVH